MNIELKTIPTPPLAFVEEDAPAIPPDEYERRLETLYEMAGADWVAVYASLAGFVGFYTVLLMIEMYLMVKYARKGPASLGTGKYYGEDTHKVHVSPSLNLPHDKAEVNHVV